MKTRLEIRLGLSIVLALSVGQAATGQIAIGSSLHDDTEADPGSTYSGTIVIRNLSSHSQEAKIYQTDYTFRSDGTNNFGEPGTESRSNARWVQVSASTVTVPPNGVVPLDYSVDVPELVGGQPPVGSYWSMIMVEGVPRNSMESTIEAVDSEIRLGVRQVVRYGIQIATHVRGTGESRLQARNPVVSTSDSGSVELRVALENVGSRLVVPETWVEVYDENGAAVGQFDGVLARIYPGTSVSQRYLLGDLAPGSYTALAIFDSGGETVDAAEYAVTIE